MWQRSKINTRVAFAWQFGVEAGYETSHIFVDKCTCEIMRDEKYIRQFFTLLSLTKSHEFFRVN